MIRFLWHIAVNLLTSALGLLIAAWLIPGVTVSVGGFLTAVAIFALAQAILGPLVISLARKYASALLGGIGLVSTLLALFIAQLLPGGLRIIGVQAWVLAPLIVWIVTALGGWLLVSVVLKKRLSGERGAGASGRRSGS